MSASREKKQRQVNGPSQAYTKAQKEKEAYQKKVRTYTAIGIVVVVLAAALLIWNSGIFQKNATAVTVDNTKLSVSELGYYYYDARYLYAAYGMIDSSKPDSEQMYDSEKGTTFQDYFLDLAMNNIKETYALYEAALKAGHTDSEVKEAVNAQIDAAKSSAASNGYSYKAFLKAVYGRYMTPGVFEKLTTRDQLANLYYNEVVGEKRASYSAADLDAYYKEHKDDVDSFKYSFLYFKADSVPTKDDDGNELDETVLDNLKKTALAAAQKKAAEALALYEEGKDLADIIEQTEPTSSGNHTVATGVSSINSAYRDTLLKGEVDKAVTVDYETYGTYVVVFHERFLDETPSVDVRHILFRAETTTDEDGKTVAPSDEAWAAAKEKAEAALAEYESGKKTPEAFGALAEKYTDDAGSIATGGLYEAVTEGKFVAEFNDWLFGDQKHNPGDTAIIRHEGDTASSSSYWGYHVVYFQNYGEATWQLNVRDSLVSEDMSEWTDALAEAVNAEYTSAAHNVGN